MHKSWMRLHLCACVGMGFCLPAIARAALYNVIDLGTLPSGTTSSGFALSSVGHATGSADNSSGATVAFKYSGVPPITSLGTLAGFTGSEGLGINATDQIVGRLTTSGTVSHAFVYSGGTIHDMVAGTGTLGDSYSVANGINAGGTAVGQAQFSGGQLRSFVYSGSTLTALDTSSTTGLGGTGVGDASAAYGINTAGDIVGQASTATSGDSHAYLYTHTNSTFHDLGTLGGAISLARAINTSGEIAGFSTDAGGSQLAVKFTGAPGSTTVTSLGLLTDGTFSAANGINTAGDIVGQGDTTSGNAGFIYTNLNGIQDLNTLINPADPLYGAFNLDTANQINDNGTIIGSGTLTGGATHAFLLVAAVPEPTSLMVIASGVLLLLRRSTRRPR